MPFLPLAVFGEGGVEYSASVSASCGGKEVKIVDGKIKLDEVREYTLTYTVEYRKVYLPLINDERGRYGYGQTDCFH